MRKRPIDWYTLIPVLLLLCIGVIMVLSASSGTIGAEILGQKPGATEASDPYKYFNKQLISVSIGLVVMLVAANFRYVKLKKFVKPAAYIGVGLLIIVFGFAAKNGAHSWIIIGERQFQPSEMVKFCLILVLANIISIKKDKIRSFEHGLLPALIAIGIVCVLVVAEPDLGTALVIAITSFAMLFAGGARLPHLAALGGAGIGLTVMAVVMTPYRFARWLAFIDPFKDPRGSGYQIIQSLYAIGSGGLMGAGLGQSMQKFGHVPEQHTDFIFSILSEELGFIGASFIIILFIFFAARGYRIAKNSRDTFGSLLACGITTMILVETVINIAVVTSSMPVTGITLPFISFGGSSLIFKLAAVGVLLNISRYVKKEERQLTENNV